MQSIMTPFHDSLRAQSDDNALIANLLTLQSVLPMARKQYATNPTAQALINATQTYKASLKTVCASARDLPLDVLEQYRAAQGSDDHEARLQAEITLARSSALTRDLFNQMMVKGAAYDPQATHQPKASLWPIPLRIRQPI